MEDKEMSLLMKPNSTVNLIKPCAFPSAVIIWKEYLKVKGYFIPGIVIQVDFVVFFKGALLRSILMPSLPFSKCAAVGYRDKYLKFYMQNTEMRKKEN